MQPRKIFLAVFIFVFLVAPSSVSAEKTSPNRTLKLIFFYSHTCHKCITLQNEFMPIIQKKFKEKIKIEFRDIMDIENYNLLLGLKEQYGVTDKNGLPVLFLGGKFLSGEDEVKKELMPLIELSLKQVTQKEKVQLKIDLISRFLAFRQWSARD